MCAADVAIGSDQKHLKLFRIDSFQRTPILYSWRKWLILWPPMRLTCLLHEEYLAGIDDGSASASHVAIRIIECPSQVAPENVYRKCAQSIGRCSHDRLCTQGLSNTISKEVSTPTCPERTHMAKRAASSTQITAGSIFLFCRSGAIMRTTAPTLMMKT